MESPAIDKQELVDWIKELEDQAILENIKILKESTEGKDWWDEISEAERESIRRGEEDIKAGRVYTNEEFWEKIQNYINKRA